MSQYYEELIQSLQEVLDDVQSGGKKLKRRVVTIEPVKEYKSEEIKNIRNKTGLSQRLFASYLGVSNKTVEAWESGKNHPSGAACRLLHMMELDENLINEFPFVKVVNGVL